MDELPELYPFTGSWDSYVEELYRRYLAGVVYGDLYFEEQKVRSRFHPETDGKGFGFWHLISEGDDEDNRTPDFRRCERIDWVPWLIENYEGDRIKWWKNKRKSNTHVLLWLEEENFVVVLAERKDYYLLKTAYVPERYRKRQFLKEWKKYWA